MKKLLFLIPLCLCLLGRGQSIDSLVKNAVTAGVNKFSGTLLSDTVITATRTGTFNIDTLFVPRNTQVIFEIDLSFENLANKETGRAGKKVLVKNVNGIYKLYTMGDYPLYSADPTLIKAGWSILQVGNLVVIQCIGIAAISINWLVDIKANYPQTL